MSIFDGLGSFVGGLFGNPGPGAAPQAATPAPADPVADAINNPYRNLPIAQKLQLLGASLQDLNHPGALDQAQQSVLAQRQAAVKSAMLRAYLGGAPQLSSTAGPAQSAGSASAAPAVAALQGSQAAPGGAAPQMTSAAPQVSAPAVAGGGLPNPYPMSLQDAQRRDTMAGFLGMQGHDVENYLKANHYSSVNGRMVNDSDPRISVNQMPADGSGLSYVADPSQPSGYRAVPVSGYMTTPDKDTGISFAYGPDGPMAVAAPGFNAAQAQNTATQAQVKAQTDLQYAGPTAQAKAYGEGLGHAQTTPATGLTDPSTGAPIQGASQAQQLGLPDGGPPMLGGAPPVAAPAGGVQPSRKAPRVRVSVISTADAPRIGQPAPPQSPAVPRLGVSPATTANIASAGAADTATLRQLRTARDRASVNLPLLREMAGLDQNNDLGQGPLNGLAVTAGSALNGLGANNRAVQAAQRYNANATSLFKNGVWGSDGAVDGGADSGNGQTGGMQNVRNPKEFALMMSSKPDVNMSKGARQALVQAGIEREQLATKLANGAEYWASNYGSLSSPATSGANKGLNFYQIRAKQEQAASDRMLARWKQLNGQ